MHPLDPNDPCPCGSGKRYRKCCIEDGYRVAIMATFVITPTSSLVRWSGDDVPPELVKMSLVGAYFSMLSDQEPLDNMERIIEIYNEETELFAKQLGRPYGELLKEMDGLLGQKRFSEVLERIKGLHPHPDMCSLMERRDAALFGLGTHPLKRLLDKLPDCDDDGRHKRLIGLRHVDFFRRPCRMFLLSWLEEAGGRQAREKMLVSEVLKAVSPSFLSAIGDSELQRLDRLLLSLLADPDEGVRDATISTMPVRGLFLYPENMLFELAERLKANPNGAESAILAKAILTMHSDALEDYMKEKDLRIRYAKARRAARKAIGGGEGDGGVQKGET